MTAQEMWKSSGLTGTYEAWAFGDAPDALAKLVADGVKTATCSALALYEAEGESLPEEGQYSVVLDGEDRAVCIIQTTKVYIAAFRDISAEHARKEGEGGRSLAYWRQVHKAFFTQQLSGVGQKFTEDSKLVCEEFKVVYK